MKRLLFLFVLFTVCSVYTAVAQQLITLDKNDTNFANPRLIELKAGESFQFKAIDGGFDILIRGAGDFIENINGDLRIKIDSSSNNPLSEIYKVKDRVKDEVKTYQIYCITNNSWPDAPPRIIIVSQ